MLFYVLDGELVSRLIAGNGLMLRSVVFIGSSYVLQEAGEPDVEYEYAYLDDSLDDIFKYIDVVKPGKSIARPLVARAGRYMNRASAKATPSTPDMNMTALISLSPSFSSSHFSNFEGFSFSSWSDLSADLERHL